MVAGLILVVLVPLSEVYVWLNTTLAAVKSYT
jgi:hypothetical protein